MTHAPGHENDQHHQEGTLDLWLAALMVFFLGVGAFATYALTAPDTKKAHVKVLPNNKPFEGTSFDTPVSTYTSSLPQPDQSASKKSSTSKSTQAKTTAGEKATEYKSVSFDILGGFFYEDPNAGEADEVLTIGPKIEKDIIPAEVLALKGKPVAVKGFMVPIKVEDGVVKTFLLVKNQMLCCYGQMPRLNDWVYIKMKEGATADFFKDIEVTVYGTLDVGEEKEKGIVLSIYRMEADRMEGPLDL